MGPAEWLALTAAGTGGALLAWETVIGPTARKIAARYRWDDEGRRRPLTIYSPTGEGATLEEPTNPVYDPGMTRVTGGSLAADDERVLLSFDNVLLTPKGWGAFEIGEPLVIDFSEDADPDALGYRLAEEGEIPSAVVLDGGIATIGAIEDLDPTFLERLVEAEERLYPRARGAWRRFYRKLAEEPT